jgi:hypothetical protein
MGSQVIPYVMENFGKNEDKNERFKNRHAKVMFTLKIPFYLEYLQDKDEDVRDLVVFLLG